MQPPKTVSDRLWRNIFDAIPPLPSLTVSGWADKYRQLSSDAAAEPGKWKNLPYQVEPMDAPFEPDVHETVLWWAAQTGKSEVLLNQIGFLMHADPSPQLLVQPTVELYEAFSKERVAPMIRDTPVLRRCVRDPRSRDSGNTTAFKRYSGGSLAMVGANAPAGLAGRPRRAVLQDEVDRYPASAGTEGDPCALADKRAESFPNAIKVKTSTATVKGLSKIENLYEKSDKRQWFVKCPRCQHEHVLLWSHVQWPEGKPEEAWLECPSKACGAKLTDADRIDMVRGGRWVATAPFRGVRGYWLNGLNTLFRHHKGYRNRLHQFVEEFLKAKDGGAQTMRAWINTFLAETYEEDATKLDANDMMERVEGYTPDELPEGVLIVTASADVQRMRIEVEFKGWGKDEESWGIKHIVLDGDTEKDEVWQALDTALLEEFKREDGVTLKVSRAFVDMGYRTPRVLAFCAPRIGRGVYPCRGINRVGLQIPPLLPAKPSRNNKARIPHWNVGVTVAKTALHDRVALPVPGPRSMHFAVNQGFDVDYFQQFASEQRYRKFSFGQEYFVFEKANNSVRNEALDLNVYNLAAVHSLFPILWNKLAENLKKSAPKIEPPAEEKITKEDLKQAAAEQKEPAPAPEVAQKPPAPAPQPRVSKFRQFRRPGFVKRW